MKKFTKILSRRLAKDGGPSNGQRPHTSSSSTLYEAPCFHQLSSSRLLHGGKPTRAPPPSSSRLVADEVPELMCATCAGIDFPRLLDWRPGQPRPWVGLSHVLEHDGEPGCPYCAFFRALLGVPEQDGNEGGKFAPYLRIRLAFERLGVREKHELGGAVLIEVMARNKNLPWGYVVKAAEEDGASMAGYLGNERVVGIKGRTVTPLLDPALAKTWVKFCQKHHEVDGCGRREPLAEGLRLVDVEERRVVSVEDLDTSTPEYATLSYVWGEGGWGEELGGNEALPEDIPPLIADAVDFTKSLGFRYLWIDRYCFLQLPDDVRRRQLDLMGEVFAQSSLTLVVAAGDGVSDGIPGISVARDPQLSLKTESGLFVTSLLRPDLEIASSTWASRAWTYQEGLFSRRRLVFTSSQTYFQCRTLHCHESLSVPLELAPGLNLGRVFPETGAGTRPDHLRGHIKTYMGKHLTRPDDRLDAFRGVLHHYTRMSPLAVDSLLALPLFHPDAFATDRVVSQTDRLATALGWLPNRTLPSQTTPSAPYLLDPSRRFPSWTWLAWHLRPGHTTLNHSFDLTLDDISAPPKMEISVGFSDGGVLSWEIDGDAIGKRREDAIRFLRVRSYVFTLVVRREGDTVSLAGVSLGRRQRDAVKGWFRAEEGVADGEYQLMGVLVSGRNWRGGGDREATVLVCRREGWKRMESKGEKVESKEKKEADKVGEEEGTKNSEEVEEKEDHDIEEKKGQDMEKRKKGQEVEETKEEVEEEEEEEGHLVRLGALVLSYADFTPVDDETAVMGGVELDGGDKGDVNVELREIDIY